MTRKKNDCILKLRTVQRRLHLDGPYALLDKLYSDIQDLPRLNEVRRVSLPHAAAPCAYVK